MLLFLYFIASYRYLYDLLYEFYSGSALKQKTYQTPNYEQTEG